MLAEVAMATLEERVAYLEGQVSEHSHTLIEIRDSVRHLEQRFDARFEQLERRFEQLEGRCDTRFDQLERRFETRFDVSDRRFEALDDKVARHFTWLVGIQVTTLAAIVGALLARA
jgi:predicted  nucleic acid-binding Zn-ribbon protein